MSYRQERKYRLSNSDFLNFKQYVTGLGASKLYDSRIVTSIYFDTAGLRMFHESEEGLLPRKKLRIRSYGLGSKKFVLETKISSIEGRFKVTKDLNDVISRHMVLNKQLLDPTYGYVSKSIEISYTRSYMSVNGLRITFDENITYKNLRRREASLQRDPEKVVEIKAPENYPLTTIERMLPLPTARFSKYSRGLLQTS